MIAEWDTKTYHPRKRSMKKLKLRMRAANYKHGQVWKTTARHGNRNVLGMIRALKYDISLKGISK